MKWASLQKLGSLRRKHCHTETMSASVNFKPCRWKSTGVTLQCFDIRLCPLPWTQQRLLSSHSPNSIMMDGKWHWRNVRRVGAPRCPTAATPGPFSRQLLTLALQHHNLSTLLWQIEKLPCGRKWGVSGLRHEGGKVLGLMGWGLGGISWIKVWRLRLLSCRLRILCGFTWRCSC